MPGAQPFSIQLGQSLLTNGPSCSARQEPFAHGIMRADYVRHATHLQSFDKIQARTIRAALMEPSGQR